MKDLNNEDPGVHNLLLSLYAKKVNPFAIMDYFFSCCMLTAGSSCHSFRLQTKHMSYFIVTFTLCLLDTTMFVLVHSSKITSVAFMPYSVFFRGNKYPYP